ncbi:Uncharacterized protein involved in response to NO [Microbulbifer donghaiensis]|uniref:Uncharacterized protein involved in response to NO n=1 Tax=Microbulbifer donghaiensis TaxID=494016 RepID=A0A1M4XUZ9_9GAMM|nr:NnrS family protein [Microbulbifer donghaiensis]SHE97176.1 Uncharacterized protein involved in response to NO [Microbulbifer donghaiensis]
MHRYPTQRLFFVSATVLAIIAPWLLLLTLTGQLGLQFTIAAHSKSMLFGFVGALIAGYLAGKQRLASLLLLYGLWLSGRILEVFATDELATGLAYSAFGILLALLVAPKFKAAKKWRNRTMMPLIALIGCFPLARETLPLMTDTFEFSNISFVLMISTLMYFMGGRLITPSLTRAFAESGLPIVHRVQPQLEAATLALLFAAICASLFSAPTGWIASPAIAAALLILFRLYRWNLSKLGSSYSSLWAFVAGYIWLALGILAVSFALVLGHPLQSGIHIITIGALGTLSSTVILRFCVANTDSSRHWYYSSILLLAGATAIRYSVNLLPENATGLLFTSACLWSLNFAVILFGACRRKLQDRPCRNQRETITNNPANLNCRVNSESSTGRQ